MSMKWAKCHLMGRGFGCGVVLCAVMAMLAGCDFLEPPHILESLQPASGYKATGESITVSGKSSPEASIEFRLFQGNQVVRSDYVGAGADGSFRFELPLFQAELSAYGMKLPLEPGDYQIKVVAKDAQGQKLEKIIAFSIAGGPPPPPPPPPPDDDVKKGDDFIAMGKYAEAIAVWSGIAAQDRPPDLDGKIAQARKKMKKQEAEKTVAEGDRLMARGEYTRAIHIWSGIAAQDRPQGLDGKIAQARQALKKQEAEKTVARGDKLMKAGKYSEAIAAWEGVEAPYQSDLGDRIAQARKKLKEKIDTQDVETRKKAAQEQVDKAEELLDRGQYTEAITLLKNVDSEYGPSQVQEKIERAQKVQAQVKEGDALVDAGRFEEALKAWEGIDPELRPQEKVAEVKKAQALQQEQEGDLAFNERDFQQAVSVWKSIPTEYASGELPEKIKKAETRQRLLQDEIAIDKVAEGLTASQEDEANWTSVLSSYEKLAEDYQKEWPEGSAGVLQKKKRTQQTLAEIIRITKINPIQLAQEMIQEGNMRTAINFLDRIPEDNDSYKAATWNVAILSLFEEEAKDIPRALAKMEILSKIDQSVYVPYYRGLAHYEKARTLEDLMDTDNAIEEYNRAIEYFEEAASKKTLFSRQKVRDVPLLPPEEHIIDLNYFMGVSYYFLFKYATYNYDVTIANKYKLSARDNLISYLRKAKMTTHGAQREPEARAKLEELK
jgi:hypothetical protein